MTILTDQRFRYMLDLEEMLHQENYNQIKKWGIQSRTPFEWLAFTTEELGELSNAISEYEYRNGTIDDIIDESIQTATLSLKIAEMYIDLKNKLYNTP